MWWWEACWKKEKKHLQLAFECEGGGSAKRRVETPKKNGCDSHLDARDVVVGSMLEEGKKNTSGSRLNAREVVVPRDVSRRLKKNDCSSHLDAREVVVRTCRNA